jgi:hypothetical protein
LRSEQILTSFPPSAHHQRWNAIFSDLSFAPTINATNFRGFCITGTAWGTYSQSGPAGMASGTATLEVRDNVFDTSAFLTFL